MNYFLPFFLLCVLLLQGCKNQSKAPMPGDLHDNQNCYHNGKLTESERLIKVPFNQAKTIKVISFSALNGKAPIVSDTIDYKETIESISLNNKQINQLTDILYNYNYSKKTNLISKTETGCYYPRHAIVFLDDKNHVQCYIEICLECKNIKTTLSPENIGRFCNGKYDLIENYFKGIGIKYFKE